MDGAETDTENTWGIHGHTIVWTAYTTPVELTHGHTALWTDRLQGTYGPADKRHGTYGHS